MKNFCKKYKSAISIITFIIFVAPLSYFITTTLLKNIKIKADKIQEKLLDNSLEKQKIEKIPQMELTNAEFENDKDATGTILKTDAKVDFIKYLEGLAESTGNEIKIKMLENKKIVKVKSTVSTEEDGTLKVTEAPKSLEEKLTYKNYITMQIDLVGDYTKLLGFVHKLENNEQYINIISIAAKKDALDENNSSKVENFKVGDIFQAPQSTAGSVLTPEEKLALKSSLIIIIYAE
jgi:hypothetical protein